MTSFRNWLLDVVTNGTIPKAGLCVFTEALSEGPSGVHGSALLAATGDHTANLRASTVLPCGDVSFDVVVLRHIDGSTPNATCPSPFALPWGRLGRLSK